MIRWQQDEKYRNSQQAHGWTEEHCRYLDYLTTIDISYTAPCTAPWHQRHRYESTITLACNDEDRHAGPLKARTDSRPTTILASLRQEQGRQNSFIPKNETLRAELEWMSQDWNWKTYFSQPSSSSSSSPFWWQHEQQDSEWQEHQDTQCRDHQWQDHQWRGLQVLKKVFAKPMWQPLCKIFLGIRSFFQRGFAFRQ